MPQRVSSPTSDALDGLKIYVAGHGGLVGSALARHFSAYPSVKLLTATRTELDLTDSHAVERWMARHRPDACLIAAGRVGGIQANAAHPAEFIYENLMIEANLIHGAWKAGVKRLLNFGSSCMYPKECPQPMKTDDLMTGKMEPTSEPYAVAKWVGFTLCSSYNRQYGTRFLTAIPCTLYGPGDSFDLGQAHVISALIRKLQEAKQRGEHEVTLWGSGRPRREFLYADDLAQGCELLLTKLEEIPNPVNIGPGISHSIREIAQAIAQVVGFRGQIRWDLSKPDGAPEKLLDSSFFRGLNWVPRTDLTTGLERTYRWYLEHSSGSVDKEPACVSS